LVGGVVGGGGHGGEGVLSGSEGMGVFTVGPKVVLSVASSTLPKCL
jgi:hypothetical protein